MAGIPSGRRAAVLGRPQRRVTGALRRTTHKYIGNSSGQLLDGAVNVEILFAQAGGRDALLEEAAEHEHCGGFILKVNR